MGVLFRKELVFLMGLLQRRGPGLARHRERARGVCPDWGGDAGMQPLQPAVTVPLRGLFTPNPVPQGEGGVPGGSGGMTWVGWMDVSQK